MSKLDAYKAKYLLAANVMAINEAISVEQYAVKKKMHASQPHLFDSHAGQENLGVGRWITIGAEEDGEGGHHGGHHVFVGGDGRMKTGAFAGKTMDEAFGGKKDEKNSRATPNVAPATQGVASTTKPIEHNDATKKAVNDLLRVEALTQKRKANNRDVDRAFAARSLLFDHGWSSDDVEKAMAEAKHEKEPDEQITPNDPLKSIDNIIKANEATGRPTNPALLDKQKELQQQAKPAPQQPAPSGIQQPPTAPGDQLGLFGGTFKAPAKKPMFEPTIATGGKQASLFDTSGNANQMQLFSDGATPEDLVYKPEAQGDSAEQRIAPDNTTEAAVEAKSKGWTKTKTEDGRDAWVDSHGIMRVKAKAGGETSDVTGKFHAGGSWMPIHGMSKKSDKPPKSFGGEETSGKPKESQEPPKPREISKEEAERIRQDRQRQERWDAIKSGHLNDVFGMGERPHGLKNTLGGTRTWQKVVEDANLNPEHVKKLADEYEGKMREWARNNAGKGTAPESPDEAEKGYIENAEGIQDGGKQYWTKKILKSHPDLPRLSHYLSDHLEEGGNQLETLHDLHSKIEAMKAEAKSAAKSAFEPTIAGITTESPKPPKEAVTPTAKATNAHSEAIEQGSTPREAAKAAQKEMDADYAFARASSVRNAGEDLKGSARHRVNEWKSLEDAEKNGTAEAMVKRDELLKHEPHDLMSHAHKNPASSLAMHFAMRAFPAKPGSVNKSKAPKDREEYLAAYRDVKAKAEELAQKHEDPDKAISELQKHVRSMIDQKRIGDRTNATANDLVGLHNALKTGYFAPKTGPQARTQEFLDSVKAKYGEDWSSNEAIADSVISHAHDIMEGKSMNATFGKESKAQKRVDPSEAYVKHATRKGGRDMSSVIADPNKATKHMVDEFGLRGVQWGNTVSDEERKHHAGKVVESIVDLADVVGLHPKDIALNGKLGIAIGARGKGTASAHYEPGSQVINLTRASGVGTLAHEWGHAFDHMLNEFGTSRKDMDSARASANYMSGDHQNTHHLIDPSGRKWNSRGDESRVRDGWKMEERPKLGIRKAYAKLEEAQKGYRKRLKDYLRGEVRNKTMSQAKAEDYWNSDHEIFARSFERHVMHKLEKEGRENTYLSGLGGEHPLWPTKAEAAEMAPAFDAIFEEYRKQHHGSPEKVKFSREHAMSALARYIERYAGKNQGVFDFADTDHEPVAATSAKGARKSMRKVEIAADTGGLRIVGISKDVDQCDRCGRTHLEKTIIVQVGDDEGERYFFGSDCISKIMGGEPSKWMAKAVDADYRAKVKAASTPKPKENYSDEWLSIERYEWNEQLHPRVAAGQSTGGQFTHGGGGSGASVGGFAPQSSLGPINDNRQTDYSGWTKFKPTIAGQSEAKPQQKTSSTKVRELAELPDKQKHHSLHIDNQPVEMQLTLSDHAKSLRGIRAAAIRVTQWNGQELTEDNIWANMDKQRLQSALDNINKANQESIAKGGPRLDDLMNYNEVIPRPIAERLAGGSRFFDPEKLRGRWHEEEPKQAEQTDAPNPQQPQQTDEQADAPTPARSDEQPQGTDDYDEWNQQGIEEEKPRITADDFKKAFRPKPPVGISKFKMKQLEKAIRSTIRDDDDVVKAFVPLVIDAWKQVKDEVDSHNLALRQITGATARDHSERDAKKGKGATIQSLAALTRKARAGELQPDEKKRFDEWVHDMETQFPHLLAGKGEMGLVDMIATGIKPAVDILDQEVAERAITLAGPDFFASMEDPGEPDFRDEFQPDYEQTPFSWLNVPELFERTRYEARAERVRYGAKSEAQIEAGNYKKKHITVQGLRISIETKKGERRRPEWPPMPCDYGDIRGTDGADGDAVDVFVGPDHDSDLVVVVDQVDESGKWDEHKCILGFHSEAEAIECYKKAYTPGWKVGPVTTMTIKQFKAWLADGNTKKKISKQVSKYSWMFEPSLS